MRRFRFRTRGFDDPGSVAHSGAGRRGIGCARQLAGRPGRPAALGPSALGAILQRVIERIVDDELVVIAKAHCEDSRTFDATQRDGLEDFEITECTPTEQAC